MTRLLNLLRRFRRSDAGTATIEFVFVFPAVITIMLSGIEMGLATLQQAMLERAMDMTVRDIRLGTGTSFQHDTIRNTLCQRAGFIHDCQSNLRLEMVQVDPRNWSGISTEPDCIDHTEDVTPVRSFTSGDENDLMILRACVRIDPIFPTTGLGKQLAKGSGGQYALVATSAFVQEPR